MSTIIKEFTKEQLQQIIETDHVQCGEASALARIALASLEAEAVGEVIEQQSGMMLDGLVISEKPTYRNIKGIHNMKMMPLGTKFYTAPPAPVVPAPTSNSSSAFEDFWSNFEHPFAEDDELKSFASEIYRAAMLQGAEPVTTAYKSPDDFICMLTGRAKYLREKGEIKSPELLERAAAALQDEIVNTPPIPNGWKLVPIDPTKDMLRAGQSVVGFWLNTVHCYSKMLAAAPEAPQQEVK
ncbi:hypothetical protein H8V75_11950 [Enterobacter roggenkampii]|uniref:hypothetical protein n=1 Tax=Enterobacter roggenkampii TaxID=1812935 RepID=UPI001E3C5F58|nr:hypothetical protein [Enterobacter roggenkampii]MCC7579639.1 hypothetical protein [Enterobacter roggenkampii]MCC7588966.1 hypothetical protein [Enterobacter roggenkampii]MCC7593563.1 hypothetical protein [Enterobacter roggenkampii]MCC7603087.1 hypothetical protein [Enterobacter roggenkampii]MCC7608265.1 hypothetical protein [Enterobacter roggenkampii]